MKIIWSKMYFGQFDLKNSYVRLVDGATGTGKPNKLTIKIGDGNLNFDESKVFIYTLDRGRLDTVRQGDEMPMDVNFDFKWTHIKAHTTSAAFITVEDALKRRNGASAWVSSASDLCEPYALDVEVWYDPQCTTEQIETITLPDFRYEKLAYDAKASMVKCSGKCNATEATIVRSAQT